MSRQNRKSQPCTVEGCEKLINCRGLCSMHYWRWKTHGDVTVCTTNRYLPERERFWMKVKKGASCWIWDGAATGGYGTFTTHGGGPSLKAHRYAYEELVGPIAEDEVLDHKCFNTLCVNPSHLRPATRKQNGEHRKGARRDNKSSGVLGVSGNKSGTYSVAVTHNGKRHYGGTYPTLTEAAEAVRQLRLSLYTHNDVDRRVA